MENNKNTTNKDPVCEKIYKAIWPNSTIRENPKLDQKTTKSQAASSEVPIVFNTLVLPVPPKEKEHATKSTGQEVKVASKTEPIKTRVVPNYDTAPEEIVFQVKPKTEGKTLGHNNDGGDDFSKHISRMKAKIRTTSNIGVDKGRERVTRLDSLDVKVGDYLKRTKMKLRTMSGIGGGRTMSKK